MALASFFFCGGDEGKEEKVENFSFSAGRFSVLVLRLLSWDEFRAAERRWIKIEWNTPRPHNHLPLNSNFIQTTHPALLGSVPRPALALCL